MVRPASATVRPKRLRSSTVLRAGVPAAASSETAAVVFSATSAISTTLTAADYLRLFAMLIASDCLTLPATAKT